MQTSIYHEPEVTPMPKSAGPVTEASIREAREACARERESLGLNPDPDAPAFTLAALDVMKALPPHRRTLRIVHMPLRANVLPVELRSELQDDLDLLVERFGFQAVKLAVEQIEAANQEVGQ